MSVIQQYVADQVPMQDRTGVEAVIIDELRRVHEGALARYRLRPSQLLAWRNRQQ